MDTKCPNRMENYMVHVSKYDFSSLTFPVPLSSMVSSAVKNNISINVYGIENGQKMIYPLRVSDVVVPDSHVDLLLHELGEIQQYSAIKDFSRSPCLLNSCAASRSLEGLLSCAAHEVSERPKVSVYKHPETVGGTFCGICRL